MSAIKDTIWVICSINGIIPIRIFIAYGIALTSTRWHRIDVCLTVEDPNRSTTSICVAKRVSQSLRGEVSLAYPQCLKVNTGKGSSSKTTLSSMCAISAYCKAR